MKLTKVLLNSVMGVILAAGEANAKDQGHGKVTFTGSINRCSMNTPCC